MKIVTLLGACLLVLAQNVSASVYEGKSQKIIEAPSETLLTQHLWDEEWTDAIEIEEVAIDEALLLDSPEENQSELVAGAWWDINATPEMNLLTQHLWDEEWSEPIEMEEVVIDEALILDSPELNESKLVAGAWWDIHTTPELYLLSQHLWDEEWSEPIEKEAVVIDEALLLDSPDLDETELVAGAWWDTQVTPDLNLLTQHLWDEEWSERIEKEDVAIDEALLLDSPELDETELVAGAWWDTQATPELNLLSQHLWDEEWSEPINVEEVLIDEALILDSPELNESVLVAGAWWDIHASPEVSLLSQHLWDEEWSVPLESEKISVDEALLLDAPKIDETQLIAGSIWNIEVQNRAVS